MGFAQEDNESSWALGRNFHKNKLIIWNNYLLISISNSVMWESLHCLHKRDVFVFHCEIMQPKIHKHLLKKACDITDRTSKYMCFPLVILICVWWNAWGPLSLKPSQILNALLIEYMVPSIVWACCKNRILSKVMWTCRCAFRKSQLLQSHLIAEIGPSLLGLLFFNPTKDSEWIMSFNSIRHHLSVYGTVLLLWFLGFKSQLVLFCGEFACSPHACVSSLKVFSLHPQS